MYGVRYDGQRGGQRRRGGGGHGSGVKGSTGLDWIGTEIEPMDSLRCGSSSGSISAAVTGGG